MKTILKYFLSLKLTVTLLSFSMVLVFCGTLAQVDKGIWTVMDQYFRTMDRMDRPINIFQSILIHLVNIVFLSQEDFLSALYYLLIC